MKQIPQPSLSLKPGKDGCGGHAWECQTAKTEVSECVCACDGKYHGIRRLSAIEAGVKMEQAGRIFIPGTFYNDSICIDCGGKLGPYFDAVATGALTPVNPQDEWWVRECLNPKHGYAWAEWKLVARGFKAHDQ